MGFLQEFKAFAMRGNVMDLAVAVVMGASFNKIVSSFVDGIIMPLIGLLIGGINITDLTIQFGDATIKWGAFLQSVIDFTLIAFSIFIVIKVMNRLQHTEEPQKAEDKKEDELTLLSQIRDLLAAKRD